MNIFKALLITLILHSTLLPYSNTCGSPLITSFTTNYINQNSTLLRSSEVGSTSEFSVRNLSGDSLDVIQFELLASDGISNFWGEVSEIPNGNINLTIIQELFKAFTLSTPAADSLNLQNGIKAGEEIMLGSPPTINGESNINILFMDIRDSYSSSGEFVAGFFDPNDQYLCWEYNSTLELWSPNFIDERDCESPYQWATAGNGLNIIYIDSNPAIIDEDGLEATLFTLAHEYQHLLHWNADLKEGYFGSADTGWTFHNPWINEGLSDLMPSILGLGLRDFTHFLDNPTIGLDEWAEIGSALTLPYYAKSALFFQYLYELEGLNLINIIFNNDMQGLASIKSNYDFQGFELLYKNWLQWLVSGELEIYADNIENQISMGASYTSIQIENILPQYSFTLFSIPEYLSIEGIETNGSLNIFLYNEGVISLSDEVTQDNVNMFEMIILFTNNMPIEQASINLSYQYISSPNMKKLFVYPNPVTTNILSYAYFGNENSTLLSIKLFDLNGRIIITKESTTDTHGNYNDNLSFNLSSGIYILQCLLDSGISESRLITIIK